MIKPRTHQAEMQEIAQDIVAGKFPQLLRIIANVTPGGGKSALPVILFSILKAAGIVDKLLWIVPRKSLQIQAEQIFTKPDWRRLLGHSHRIRTSTNQLDPFRGLAGCVTTYQALSIASPKIIEEFTRYGRLLLVLDEFHHLKVSEGKEDEQDEEVTAWGPIKEIMDNSRLSLLMTGALQRGDERRIPCLDYRQAGKVWMPILENTDEQLVVTYSRRTALNDKAILMTDFLHFDGAAQYLKGKDIVEVPSIAQDNEPRKAIWTALQTDYAKKLLRRGLQHWVEYRQEHPRSKMLIVSHSIGYAQAHTEDLLEIGISKVGIAISEDPKAEEKIRRFKLPNSDPSSLEILVTVAMAYEGLDVPQCTHTVCLTHIRSRPWIEQMLARAVRIDDGAGPYNGQQAYCFGPDDRLFHQCIKEIIAEQEAVARDKEGGEAPPPGDPTIPLASDLTDERAQDGNTGELFDYPECAKARDSMEQSGILGVVPRQFLAAMRRYQQSQTGNSNEARETAEATPSDEEKEIKRRIDKWVKRWAKMNNKEWKHLNEVLVKRFRKTRDEMTLDELKQAWAVLINEYPLEVPRDETAA